MKVLIIGSGGREHAMAWKLSQSPHLSGLYIAPGNPGTAQVGENIDMNPLDFAKLKEVVLSKGIGMVVVGPEEHLVKGLHDFFLSDPDLNSIPVIGPTSKGAMLEGSKDFAKDFMVRHGVPTARYQSFKVGEEEQAHSFLSTLPAPYVLKADGLAAGKGVLICPTLAEAKENLSNMLNGQFGKASETVVIEEYLQGIELSVFVLTDGESYVILPEAKDYKRIGEDDTGPNTGGMGAVSPVPFANKEFMSRVEEQVVKPTIQGLQADGIPYKGFIFLGLMNNDGEPQVIEYNVRLGDPEAQVVLPRLKGDLLELLSLTAQGKLNEVQVEFIPQTATAVILVSGGYPDSYKKGIPISIAPQTEAGIIFHAGTQLASGKLVTSGGRVFASVGLEQSIPKALSIAYAGAESIEYEGKYFRRDIGKDLTS